MTRPTVALSALHRLYAASLFPMPQAILCGILILIPSSWWCIGSLLLILPQAKTMSKLAFPPPPRQ